MKGFYRATIALCCLLFSVLQLHAQSDTIRRVKIAVFAPLYLDEIFQGSSYSLKSENLPKYVLPGLEFYHGVLLAIDSLSNENTKLEISIFDTRQPEAALTTLFNSKELVNTGLIIASLTSPQEVKFFSDETLKRNIPIISATYPNVAGVNANPFFVLLNSSLNTHLEAIYKHLLTRYTGSNIIAFKRAGVVENYIKTSFTQLNANSPAANQLNMKWVDLQENFTSADVIKHLDSTRNNIVFVASPQERFGLKVVQTINPYDNYRTTAIGMPTWDGIKELNGRDSRNVEIVYSTPFNYSRSDYMEAAVVKKYKTKFYSRPSDMVLRGFETTYHFGKLLLQYRGDLINNLSSNQYKLFNDFDIVPVKLRSSNPLPDYLENKKLYFIRKQGGNLKGVN